MKPKRNRKPPHFQDAAPKIRRAAGTPTKSQLRAAALADARAHVARWTTLIPMAVKTWPKFDSASLIRMKGDVHVLAGMIQMYYQLSRQEADRQVQAFFAEHVPAAPVAAAPPAAAVAPAAVAPVLATPAPAESVEAPELAAS